jgi:hypothetical protein
MNVFNDEPWLGETGWERLSVILANEWIGAPF